MTGLTESSLAQNLPGPLVMKPFTLDALTTVIRAALAAVPGKGCQE
jgi:hypothetical protein